MRLRRRLGNFSTIVGLRNSMWFSASLLFSSEYPGQSGVVPLWEEQILLLDAENEQAAKAKAETCGRTGEHEYYNAANQLVRWRFARVERIFQIESKALEDGTEIFSRFLRDSEVKSLLTPFED